MIEFLFSLFFSQPYYIYTVESGKNIKMFWKDESGEKYRRFDKIGQDVLFACNGGAYTEDRNPCGLYIEDGVVLSTTFYGSGRTNFSTNPNGSFIIDYDGRAHIFETHSTGSDRPKKIKYAVQSGPMLVSYGMLSSGILNKTSSFFIRNGVGVTKEGKVIFLMSKSKISLRQFAEYFLKLNCENALYFDGAISQFYPMKTRSTQNFGVIIAVTK